MNAPEKSHCAECGSELPPGLPRGLCPHCALQAAAGPTEPANLALPTAQPGDRIGRYKLLQQIGEGGCGVVFMAEQEEPIRRKVALKVIKLGMDTRSVIARFEAERQALALMDHPNIARVFDAGATDTGRPYFVMELVRGVRITDYCDQHNLTTTARLDLFTQVCHAIQHAHQKGIIHRDIKPSNILVTLHDGVPVPKVIDFGIAKATSDQRLTDKTLFTAFEQFMGTPAYMSPEQTEMSGLDIDTRSDIYALGVMLYELLTGKTPFDAKEMLASGLDAMRRTIREQEPAKPSTRLNTMLAADLTMVASRRQTEPTKLASALRGDLDWIVMKALEKDRTRRYDTARALAADLQRHLSNEPVTACPPSQLYRLAKLVLRNKRAFGSTAVAGFATLAALIIGMRFPRVSALPGGNASPETFAATNTTRAPVSPLRLISGFITAEDTGQPLADALVRIASPSIDMRNVRQGKHKLYEGRTDRAGRFKIRVPQERTFSLDAFSPGYESAAGSLSMRPKHIFLEFLTSSPTQRQEFTVKLPRASYVAGVVVDEEGLPFADAKIEATMERDGYVNVASTGTDAAGRFEIFDFSLKPLDNERGQLTFQTPAMLRSRIEDVYKLSEAERKTLRVTLRRGHGLRGTLTSAGGRPVGKTVVVAVPSDTHAQSKQQVTDAEGRFLIRGLPDGEVIVRAHSLMLEQKGQIAVRLAGADVDANIRLEPVVLKTPTQLITLFGMRLANLTPELQVAYDLDAADTGVLIVDPGDNHRRLGIGTMEGGEYVWMVGKKEIKNLQDMVTELLRISEIEPPACGGLVTEGHRGDIRVVYSKRDGSNTAYMKLTDEDVAELKKLAAVLPKRSL